MATVSFPACRSPKIWSKYPITKISFPFIVILIPEINGKEILVIGYLL
jgi:hypothetical protein